VNPLPLFEQATSGTFPTPRPFQDVAHQALRDGLRAGHMNQLLVAPTGSGKTVVGLRVIHEALQRGKRGLFVCDRIALINQTSERADSYGMTNHAIVQAGHWRRDNSQPFQICSIQTIQRRGFWPDADVIVLDEAHTLNSAAIEKLERKSIPIIGLTATPCTKGLGLYFTNMVNAATMHELTQSGVLVPMRIMTCITPDMAGAETSGGEWTAKAAGEREAKIIGDVVGEWTRHADNRKTIAFGADIAYCTQLVQRFNEAGINAATFTSETPDRERAELLAEFSKPNSEIRILVSVEALAKGFDVPDIGCVIDARPLRKSLSTAIQMWGRGLRSSPGKTECLLLDHCIASGQRVLTDRGLVPIEQVTLSHKLWDGHEYVAHKGVVSRGIRPILRYAGLAATADHPVKTAQGWRTLGQCADEQIPIRKTGVGRAALRECDDHFSDDGLAGAARAALSACIVRVRWLWLSLHDCAAEFAARTQQGLSGLQPAQAVPEVAVWAGQFNAPTLQQPEGQPLSGLWRKGDRVPFRVRDHLRSLDQTEFGHSGESGVNGTGQDQQRRALRAGQYPVGRAATEHEQHARIEARRAIPSIPDRAPRSALRRCIAQAIDMGRRFLRGNRAALASSEPQAEGQVWDILEAGPRNCFTCEGLLVHNSGNIKRFLEDFEDVFYNGFKSLSTAEKQDSRVRDDSEYTPSGCPKCQHKPFHRRCLSCGFEKVSQALEDTTQGVMKEIMIGKRVAAADPRDLWNQLCTYAKENLRSEKKAGWAWHKYRDLTGQKVPRDFPPFDFAPEAPVSAALAGKLKSMRVAYFKAKEKAA
jgi:superfamily II DNA or RNA helicase